MRRKQLIILFFILLFLFIIVFSLSKKGTAVPMTTWVWDTRLIENEGEQINDFFTEMNVSKVYLQINNDVSFQSYREFISEMKQINVEVHALDGSPDWGLTNNRAKDEFLHWLSSYQQTAEPNEQFSGIHLDIEPYLLEAWETQQQLLIEQYLAVIKDVGIVAQEMEVSFGIDIPFWFDEIKFINNYGEGNLAKWLIQEVDEVTIMAYRNEAAEIIQIVDLEINWANQFNKSIIIAVETMSLPEFHTTFYEAGIEQMHKQLDIVQMHYQKEKSFAGFAIHHYDSWRTLKNELGGLYE